MTRLQRWLNMVTWTGLPSWSAGPTGSAAETAEAISAAGYEGVQLFRETDVEVMRAEGLAVAALVRADTVEDLTRSAEAWEAVGADSLTVHYGTGFEPHAAGLEMIESFVELDERMSMELLLETHRATLTQDPSRTLEFVNEFPTLRFTADLGHWYTGVQMTYGGFDWKVEALQPIFERTRFIHGRISSPSHDQVSAEADRDTTHFRHFCEMWRTLFAAVSSADGAPAHLPFAPELLRPRPRNTDRPHDRPVEDVDRWKEATLLCELAEQLFTEAVGPKH